METNLKNLNRGIDMGGYSFEADLLDKLDRIIQLLEKLVDEKNNYAELTEKYGKIDKSSKDD